MNLRVLAALVGFGAGLWGVIGSAAAQPAAEDYERALGLRERWMYLTENVADPATWLEKENSFYYRKTVKGGFQFVIVDAETREKKPAFDHERLAAALGRATHASYSALRLPFSSYSYADDGRSIELQIEEASWTCDLGIYACAATPPKPGRPRAFGVVRDLSVPADNTPRISPDGKWEAFVQGHNIVVREAGTGARPTVLSVDGTQGNFYDPETIVWSPDSRKLAAYRVRPGYRREVVRVEASPGDQLQPKVQVQLYPKPGDPVDIDRPVIFDVERRKQIAIAPDLFPNPYEMSPIEWRQDSATIAFTYDQRGHQVFRLIEVDAASGRPRVVASDTPPTFVNIARTFHHDVNKLGREIVWMSERDGWNHLYLVDGKSGRIRNQITKGAWVVRSVVKVDDDKRQIWFAASGMYPGKDPYLQHYYRVDFDGRNLTPLTTADAYHDVSFSPDMAYYVDTYSRVDQPNVSELRRTSDRSLVAEIERGDISALLAAGWKAPEVFTAKGRDGKTDIWGLIVRPSHYDPAKKYPVIENIYAGPHSSFVPKTFWPFGLHAGGDKLIGMQAQAELGFIVVQIDGMGTLNRSKAFHDVAWKNLGDSGFPDRILWHKAAAARDPSYDIGRVGIYGGSAGGQSAFGALVFHPDFYKAAVAYAGCFDNRMDKISWNEQWLGWPVDESYERASGVAHADRLQGDVLLIVGEQDSNVDPASTMQLVDALIKADKNFDLLVVPGAGHSAGRTSGPIGYALRRQYDFFVRHLQSASTPNWNLAAGRAAPSQGGAGAGSPAGLASATGAKQQPTGRGF